MKSLFILLLSTLLSFSLVAEEKKKPRFNFSLDDLNISFGKKGKCESKLKRLKGEYSALLTENNSLRDENFLLRQKLANKPNRVVVVAPPKPVVVKRESEIFYCKGDYNQTLYKAIYNGSNRIHEKQVKTWTSSYTDSNINNCRRAALNSSYKINFGAMTECTCDLSNSTSPVLNLKVMNRSYSTIVTIPLFKWRSSYVDSVRKTCEDATQNLNICNLNMR